MTPRVITWARERAGFSIEEAARQFRNIQAWEDGAASPTYPQLEQLADTFKVPVAVFFFPDPPDVPSTLESFRTLPDSEISSIPREIRFLLRKGRAFQLNLAEMNPDGNPAERLITRDLTFQPSVSVGQMASVIRDYLAVTLDEQTSWPNDEVALDFWRNAFHRVGIFVFKDAFRADDYSGFCLYDEEFPIIYVNNSAAKTRQIFTLFHELAHLLFHTSGIDTEKDDYISRLSGDARRIEVICNRFAASFLVPEAAFEEAFAGREPTEATASLLASHFRVSREVIFRKFLDRRLIDDETYAEAVARWSAQRRPIAGEAGGNWYWTKIAYLGPEYVRLAFSRYHQNRIDQIQLADILETRLKNLSILEDYFMRREA